MENERSAALFARALYICRAELKYSDPYLSPYPPVPSTARGSALPHTKLVCRWADGYVGGVWVGEDCGSKGGCLRVRLTSFFGSRVVPGVRLTILLVAELQYFLGLFGYGQVITQQRNTSEIIFQYLM